MQIPGSIVNMPAGNKSDSRVTPVREPSHMTDCVDGGFFPSVGKTALNLRGSNSRLKPAFFSNGVKVTILNFQKKIRINPALSSAMKKAVRETVFSEKQIKNGRINICLCGDLKIQVFNRNYFCKDCPTDVIAFNIIEPGQKGDFLADIIISTDTVISNSSIFKTAPLYELFFCVIHGILHVLGYEDTTEKKRLVMHKKQRQICRKIFQKDAYT